ncbi:MAG: hypothetical protein AB1486_01860 [Planctomycetota bacterium]
MYSAHARPACAAVLASAFFSSWLLASPALREGGGPLPPEGMAPPAEVSSQPSAAPDETVRSSVLQAFGRLSLAFVENRGQLDERAAFSTRQGGLSAYFTKDSIVLQLVSQARKPPSPALSFRREAAPEGEAEEAIKGANLFLTFEGASPDVVIEGADPLPGRYNYFLGNDPSKWRTGVPAYASIRYRGLYPGVDMVVRDGGGRLEYDLILEPGADVGQIVVRCEGMESLRLHEDGTLVLETAAGSLEQPKPCTYELDSSGVRKPTESSYRLVGESRFGFDVPGRDGAKLLVIDPRLVYATFLGGWTYDTGLAIALDASGAAVVAGQTSSSDFPTNPEAYDRSHNGASDAFVAKLEVPLGCENDAAWWNYGSGWPGTHGVPCLVANNDPALCFPLSLTICNSFGLPTTAFLFLGLSPADIPTPWDGRLLVRPDWVRRLYLPAGGASLPGDLPCDPAFCGLHVYLQVLELDPGASRGVSFTPGLELVFGS